MNEFSTTSRNRLNTCDIRLQKVFELAIKRSPVDFGIACGNRSIKEQQRLFASGRDNAGAILTGKDGVTNMSNHNYIPSLAVDIYAWIGEASWDKSHLTFIAGVVLSCAKELDIPLRWGGNWDGDGTIISDQKFIDLPHFELI